MEWHSDREIERIVGRMDLRSKVGQLFLCGFAGTEPDDKVRRLIGEYAVGGVIYFARNVASVEQVARMSGELQQAAAHAGTLPLWVSVDQEGGMVARLTEGVALMPGSMAIAATGDEAAAFDAARIAGTELRALGINLNFAPVLDVNVNPLNPVIGVRSFGDSAERVAAFGERTIAGYQQAGVAATAKHFPGHGDTSVDSHLDLPMIPHDRDRIDRVELFPFRRAIAAGVDAIMSAHVLFPALEPERLPGTLSRRILTGLLREELGYGGIVTTDCMEMNAIAGHYGTVEAAVMAIEAGADLVLISHSYEMQTAAIEAVHRAVRGGRIPESRIDASVRRLLLGKAKRGVLQERESSGSLQGRNPVIAEIAVNTESPVNAANALDRVGCAEHRRLAAAISERSVTLVRDFPGMLPLKRERTLAVTVAAAAVSQADESLGRAAAGLGGALSALGLDAVDRLLQPQDADSIESIVAEARADEVKQLVVGTYNAAASEPQLELARRLLALGKPLAVVALRNPYDLLALPELTVYAAAYESRPLALESAAKALLGLIPFQGRLPTALGELYPAGWRWERERT